MSKSERWCLEFIKKFMLEKQYSPSVDEIAAGLGYKSKSTVAHILSSLRKKGMITWEDGKPRTIRVRGIMIEEITEDLHHENNNNSKLQGRFWKDSNSR